MKRLFYLFILAAFSLTACKKDLGGSNEKLQAILLGKDTLKMWVGEVRQINFRTNPSDFDTTSFVWNSSDPSVISVTNLGKITALKTGTSKVSVSNQANTLSVSCQITVVPLIDSLKLGLIAYYPFNGSAADSSGNFNDGIIHGATPTTNRFGTPNSAYLFDGATNYITVNDNFPLRLSNTDYTINSWVNMSAYNSSYGSIILSKRGLGSSNGWLYGVAGALDLTNSVGAEGIITFNVSGGDDPYAKGKTAITLNTWHMVTILFKNSVNKISIYIDGVLDSETSGMPSPSKDTGTDLYIGTDSQDMLNGGITNYFMNGKIDDIRIYKRLLKPSDIQKLYTLTY